MKKCIRYFGGLMDTQENWLNAMCKKGYRLVHAGKLIYAFEACECGQYVYAVDFVAQKSAAELRAYKQFLEEFGYRVMSKNANLNWSFGKVRLRPYGDGWGKVATSPGNYNKELLIVEKANDKKPFELHTTVEDQRAYYTVQRNAYLSLLLLFIVLFLWNYCTADVFTAAHFVVLIFALLAFFPTMLLQKRLWQLQKQQTLTE